ncbi:ribokinase/fructoselysine 6-kinase [Propionicimonas paludicola]|uniref:Ribokinase/fructoselysine 6-kinase n=1 Tax=Propionicimonas paludicola TaxID=185243 RepID=A0A2A9CMZ6_9ACTN|nr:PfkB family carbohydrate kinase [Propionicimonas paludicola]PFG15794.1 ribokinase/fructoselysine 6-kinase [Propionicimonas paludicola]
MPRAKVAVVGDNTVDRFLDTGIDLIGGDALNTAVQLAMLGAEVSYFGAIGDDEPGRLVIAEAQRCGVDVASVVTMPGVTALTTIRVLPNGDRHFENEDFGVTAEYVPDEAALLRIASADWVHIGMLPRAEAFRQRLFDIAPLLPISQDCSVARGFEHLEVAFLSAAMVADTVEAAATRALEGGAQLAVVTMGGDGVYASDGEGHWQLPAQPIQPKDATGAGDAFMAGYISGFLATGEVAAALDTGVRRGAFACTYTGGWPQTPEDRVRAEG